MSRTIHFLLGLAIGIGMAKTLNNEGFYTIAICATILYVIFDYRDNAERKAKRYDN